MISFEKVFSLMKHHGDGKEMGMHLFEPLSKLLIRARGVIGAGNPPSGALPLGSINGSRWTK